MDEELKKVHEAYELWAVARPTKKPLDIATWDDGTYISNFAEFGFQAWQAAVSQERERIAGELDKIASHGNYSGVIPCPQDSSFYIEPMRTMARTLARSLRAELSEGLTSKQKGKA